VTARGESPDHFSAVAAPYAEFRPSYPPELFGFVLTLPARRRRAWDCGAGSGQATIDLAVGFDEVLASDASAKQVARAARHPKVSWMVARAEAAPIAGASVDLVVVVY
jgi:2-polyprenyl-3-methyl-5-hydroxy-6-metoxy-1,4-benzoquinol methylase